MAWRTTEEEVQQLLLAEYNDGDDLNIFIKQANAVTSAIATADTDSLLSSTMLELIECNLTAHFYKLTDRQLQSENAGDASGQYAGEFGKGYESTSWGQMAIILDVTGYLKKQQKSTKASVLWLGKAPSDQTDYTDRD
jgi:hypothetical protein